MRKKTSRKGIDSPGEMQGLFRVETRAGGAGGPCSFPSGEFGQVSQGS